MTNKEYIDRNETVSLKEWIVSYLLLSIPIAGIVFAFYWALSDHEKISKQSWAQCVLIFSGFFMVIYILLEFVFSISIFPQFQFFS
jgi:hypothetical protein